MKAILFAILILISVNSFPQQQMHRFEILRVIDGDTIVFRAPFLPAPLKQELYLRVYGVDTPEKGRRAKCDQESSKSTLATEFTKNQIAKAKDKQIILTDWDKYGGRVLGDIILDGKSLRASLIKSGHAREYFGERKTSWCN